MSAATDPTALLDAVPRGLLIGGGWRTAERTFDVRDPSDGAVLAAVADADGDDALDALAAAHEAFPAWRDTAPRERAEVLRRAFDLLEARAEQAALLISLEMGKSLEEARGEVRYGGEFLRWFAEEAVRMGGRTARLPEGGGTMIVERRAVGPCYLVTPWNFPLAMATRKIAPALAAGCTVVLKPADATPLTSLWFAELLREAGVPDGVVNVVTTSRADAVSDALLADPRLAKLSFTGSTPVGRQLLAQSAGQLLRTSMELGGNAPFLVFEDADLEQAVESAMAAKFRNIGQACTAANRFLVHASVAEAFTARLAERAGALRLGRGTDDGVDLGPLIRTSAAERCAELVADALDRGAVLRTGGSRRDGAFFEPTVLADVPAGARVLEEEVFGPIAPITTFADEDEAVALANATPYGLVAYACTADVTRAHRLLRRIRSGMLGINTGVVSNAAAPFGGVGHSGFGREGGEEGIEEYLEVVYGLIAD
ncbi:NAD-dependent succinate-semialdehyde dehydrogenase [Arenivirga flava]|uniref:NAD-dependent succinate-semialdehyde dehydrogenase n=1 Tax=Arenivirga flava TaxID=1930060 RepID=A0AA37XAG0_9MICO|nr:NAD-dependent succinate-semialdehyde dehydrogenase [Arenivirga flava]GMA27360.1 NAD-dependent succinate-semialdehyde dehydrogenase [Arenivirga flava]